MKTMICCLIICWIGLLCNPTESCIVQEKELDTIGRMSYLKAKKALSSHTWSFFAATVEAQGSNFELPDGNNYISCKGDSVSIQLGLLSLPPSNGITGFNARGRASQVVYSVDTQGNLNYVFLFQGEGIVVKIVLSVIVNSNTCNVGFYPQQAGNYLTFLGELSPFQYY